MNSLVGKSTGIPLLMAVALLAALFAMGVFSAGTVGAQAANCVEKDANDQAVPPVTAVICAELTDAPTFTGREGSPLQLVPTWDGDTNYIYTLSIVATEQRYLDVAATPEEGAVVDISPADGLADDADETTEADDGHQIDLASGVEKITITVMQDDVSATPAVGGSRTYTFNLNYAHDASDTDSADTAAKITVTGVFTVGVGGEIIIGMSNFGLPSTIDTGDVFAQVEDILGEFSDIVVKDTNIVLTLKDANTNIPTTNNTLVGIEGRPASIVFRSRTGITTPQSAGLYGITATDETGEGVDAVNVVKIVSSVSASPKTGSSSADVTVTGKGFSTGSATVFIDKTPGTAAVPATGTTVAVAATPATYVANRTYEAGVDEVIASGATITDGSFTAIIPGISKPDGEPSVTISAFDGASNLADKTATYTFSSGLSVSPDKISWGQTLTLTMSDNSVTPTEVRFGGNLKSAVLTSPAATFKEAKVKVPAGVAVGMQKVEVIGSAGVVAGLSTTVEIVPLTLTISPSDPVPGEQVTIRGSGFEDSKQIIGVTFGSLDEVALTDPSVTSTSSGSVSFTYKVPLDIGTGEKKVSLDVGERIGQGSITIPKPSISISPSESLIGSTIEITGSGFASNNRVEVFYGDDIEAVGVADSNGDVSIELTVPSTAGIGGTNPVEVKVRDEVGVDIKATANHKTPGAMITVTDQAQAGGMITISGSNFQSFSILSEVTVGGQNVLPSPAPETNRQGTFEFPVRVPLLSVGSHSVSVKDGDDNSATETFSVVATSVVTSTVPAEVFADLIDSGRLARVWYLNQDNGDWQFFDPALPDAINTLSEVPMNEVVVVIVTAGDNIEGVDYLTPSFLQFGTNNRFTN